MILVLFFGSDFMYKVCLKNKISSVGKKILSDRYEIVPEVSEADAIVVRSEKISNIDRKLLAIARAGAGVNNINIKACSESGVVVFNTPGCNANAVKELTLCGMFLAARNIIKGVKWLVEEGNALSKVEQYKKNFVGTELCGKEILVIGLGEIGTRVANSCVNLGMQVYGFDPFLDVQNALNLDRKVKVVDDYDRVSMQSDYITIHVPFNESTKKMLNKKFFDCLKSEVVILNFARGEVIDVDALCETMARNRNMKYVTDFADERLLHLDSVISLPHLGASTAEAQDNCAQMAAENLMDYLDNGNIKSSVNFPNCFLKERSGRSRITIACKNMPNVLGKIASIFGVEGVNICNMVSKSKGQVAYAIFDLHDEVDHSALENLCQIDGVIKVRLIVKKGEHSVAY